MLQPKVALARAFESRTSHLVDAWYALGEDGPSGGPDFLGDEALCRARYLAPLARLLIGALRGSVAHEAVYLDERPRYLPSSRMFTASSRPAMTRAQIAQALLKKLKEAGILLVALSKNTPESVRWPEMRLNRDDFVLEKISWRPKADGAAEAIAELDLAANAFVLLDDNPVERALVTDCWGTYRAYWRWRVLRGGWDAGRQRHAVTLSRRGALIFTAESAQVKLKIGVFRGRLSWVSQEDTYGLSLYART